jgi:hypothetical protein
MRYKAGRQRDHWVFGRPPSDPAPRWCVLRDVLHVGR